METNDKSPSGIYHTVDSLQRVRIYRQVEFYSILDWAKTQANWKPRLRSQSKPYHATSCIAMNLIYRFCFLIAPSANTPWGSKWTLTHPISKIFYKSGFDMVCLPGKTPLEWEPSLTYIMPLHALPRTWFIALFSHCTRQPIHPGALIEHQIISYQIYFKKLPWYIWFWQGPITSKTESPENPVNVMHYKELDSSLCFLVAPSAHTPWCSN